MAVVIFEVNSNNFSLNAIQYLKKFNPAPYGDNVRLVGAMDQNFELVPFTHFSEWTVDGNTFASAALLAAALSSVTYSESIIIPSSKFVKWIEIDGALVFKKDSPSTLENIEVGDIIQRYDGDRFIHALVNALPYTNEANLSIITDTVSSGGSTISTSNTLKFYDSIEGVIHKPITGALVIDDTGQVPGGFVEVQGTWDENPTISGVSSSLIQSVAGSETIESSGSYKIFIVWDGTHYLVNIRSFQEYVGTGGGDVTAPTVSSATIQNANPDKLIVVFSEVVTITNTTGLSLSGDLSGLTVDSVTGSGSTTLTFTLSGDAENGDAGNFVYGGTNNIEDGSSNGLAAGSTAITNNVGGGGDVTAPATPSITLIEDASPSDVTAPATPSITLIEDAS